MPKPDEKLNNLRLRLGLTISEMAAGIGMSATIFENRLYGNTKQSMFFYSDICEAYGVDIQYFTGDMTLEEAVKDSPIANALLKKEKSDENREKKRYDLKASRRKAGDRIRSRRKELGLTQTELANRAGVPTASVGSLEIGGRQLGTIVAGKLAPALEVDPLWLLYGEEEIPDSLGGRLLRTRQEQGITRKDLSARTGISCDTLSAIETKGHIPNQKRMDAIASALRVDPDWLEYGETD